MNSNVVYSRYWLALIGKPFLQVFGCFLSSDLGQLPSLVSFSSGIKSVDFNTQGFSLFIGDVL